jgi:hypothetical protein
MNRRGSRQTAFHHSFGSISRSKWTFRIFALPPVKPLAVKRKHLNLTASQEREKMPEHIVWLRAQITCRCAPDRESAHGYWLAARLDWVVEITGNSAISQELQSPLAASHIFWRDDRSANGQFHLLPIRSLSPSLRSIDKP